jgi:hypothetical protein
MRISGTYPSRVTESPLQLRPPLQYIQQALHHCLKECSASPLGYSSSISEAVDTMIIQLHISHVYCVDFEYIGQALSIETY